MPVAAFVAVAVCYTTAADHMNLVLDYCSQQTSPLLSILSIYYMNNSLFLFPHSLNSAFSNIEIYYSPIKYPVIVSIIAAAPAIANNASSGSAAIGIQLYKTNKKALTHTPVHQ